MTMRGTAKLAIVLLASAPLLQACSMFGGGGGDAPRTPRYASQRNADCARLAPLVTNPDGSLNHDEMEAGLKLEFKRWDKDGNGELSSAEVGPLNDSLRAQNVGASPVMDWNGDGHVSFQEFAGGWRTMFDLCAHGGGQVVSKADMERSPNVTPPRTVPAANPSPSGGQSGGHSGH
jgi:hypothetical protein